MTRPATDSTHDPALTSWIDSANDPASDFPIQSLPLCRVAGPGVAPGAELLDAVAIGDRVLLLNPLVDAGLFRGVHVHSISAFVRATAQERRAFRHRLNELLRSDSRELRDRADLRERALVTARDASFGVPVTPPNYTDFYASIHHASTVGSMFRPDNPLLPNYKHVPIGYHGRASSIVASGTPVRRPKGQLPPPDDKPAEPPTFGPCKLLDYELEVGAVLGPGNELGTPIALADAWRHIAGVCLVNDWSARDIQKWEYQPLGPFLAKNFATTVSPFLVTSEALAPFRIAASARPAGDPSPLPYLTESGDAEHGGLSLTLEVKLRSKVMREQNLPSVRLSRSTAFREMYWTLGQMLTHHSSNGCNIQPGDLIASGTVSGPTPSERGCLLELTWQGRGPDAKPLPRKAIELPTGEKRLFLEDGDEVILSGWLERDGYRRIGLGECRGTIVASER
ncbi:MAG: fumarylacetoacetase [Planctomycetota bacterium]|nr:fumarylacetoacetase [Planctomycetota bacterium]